MTHGWAKTTPDYRNSPQATSWGPSDTKTVSGLAIYQPRDVDLVSDFLLDVHDNLSFIGIRIELPDSESSIFLGC